MTSTGMRSGAGDAVAFASAIVFATGITLVALIYEDGANVHAVNLSRVLALAVVMALVLAVRRISPVLPPGQALRCVLVGVLFCGDLYGLLSSVRYIPVGLAILIIYTYPLMVAVAGWLMGTESFTLDRLLAILAAFAGLALALHTPDDAIDWRGVAWAVFTAVVFSALLIVSDRTMRGVDRRILMLYLTCTSAGIVGLVSLTAVSLEWPRTDRGWTLPRGIDRPLRGRQHPALRGDQDDRPAADRDHRQQRTHLGHRPCRSPARPAHERGAALRRRPRDRRGAAGADQSARTGACR